VEEQTRSLSEVAGLMGVSERTVRRWIKSGRLKAYKPGRDYRIPESSLRQFIEESEISPKVERRSSLEPSLFNGIEGQKERRVLTAWRDHVAARVKWCDDQTKKTEGDFNYPFSSLGTAIQWAIYVGVESTALKNAIYQVSDIENLQDLPTLAERFAALSARIDLRVKRMMEDAALEAEEKEQIHLRLVHDRESA
jgi:excisionase family DNA binding protein